MQVRSRKRRQMIPTWAQNEPQVDESRFWKDSWKGSRHMSENISEHCYPQTLSCELSPLREHNFSISALAQKGINTGAKSSQNGCPRLPKSCPESVSTKHSNIDRILLIWVWKKRSTFEVTFQICGSFFVNPALPGPTELPEVDSEGQQRCQKKKMEGNVEINASKLDKHRKVKAC